MKRATEMLAVCVFCSALAACGGERSPMNPVPTITAIAPDNAAPDGPGFTLTVNGSNFVKASIIEWNRNARPTQFISSSTLTADIPSDDIVASGNSSITVTNPGGTSNSMSFVVPCVLAEPEPASNQTRVRLGAYYFDGWSTLASDHFMGMLNGPYRDREPLSGWVDSTPCSVEQQLAWAHRFGLSFFIFDTYYKPDVIINYHENLDNALEIMHSLPDRHGMDFAIMDADPLIPLSEWSAAVDSWVAYFSDPGYMRINGKPVFFVLSFGMMEGQFGGSAAVADALNTLRTSAATHGFPGVYIVAGLTLPGSISGQDSQYPDLNYVQGEGYDALSVYNYPYIVPPVDGMLPFSVLADTGTWIARQTVLHSALPYIPTAMSGWDPRPWDERDGITGDLLWFSRSPEDVAKLVDDLISWAESDPSGRPEPAPAPPIVLIEAWNEMGEGSHFVPTIGEGTSYGDAIAEKLLAPIGSATPATLSRGARH